MSVNLIDNTHPLPDAQVGDLINLAMIEILGEDVSGMIIRELPVLTISSLHFTCLKIFGKNSGEGLMIRIGRAFFRRLVLSGDEYSSLYHPQFRLQGINRKIPLGLSIMAKILGDFSSKPVVISRVAEGYSWEVEDCPVISAPATGIKFFSFQIGILQEFMSWLGNGRMYMVEQEPTLNSCEPVCRIKICTQAVE